MKKIGIMGGTFNPIHLAHLEMARCALKQKGLDEIWFMPSKLPPHKSNRDILPEKDRSAMIKLAIEDEEQFLFSDFELQREEVTYTAKTLELLKKKYPDVAWYFIMGGDSLFSFTNWYHPEVIAKDATILVVSRNGVDDERMQKQAELLQEKYQGSFCILAMKQMDISSSSIRKKISHNENVDDMLPAKVNAFIKKQHYYQ